MMNATLGANDTRFRNGPGTRPLAEDKSPPTMEVVNVFHLQKCPPIVTVSQEWTYTCLKSEVCCDTGCCTNDFKAMNQFWYAWFIITILCAFLLGCFHYYKKQKVREFQSQQMAFRRNMSRAQQQYLLDQRGLHPPPPSVVRQQGDLTSGAGLSGGAFVNFLRQYNAESAGHPAAAGDASLDRESSLGGYRWTRAEYHDQMFDRLARFGGRGLTSCRGASGCLARNAATAVSNLAPPPSYDTLDHCQLVKEGEEEEEPPPVYLEACQLIADFDQGLGTTAVDIRDDERRRDNLSGERYVLDNVDCEARGGA